MYRLKYKVSNVLDTFGSIFFNDVGGVFEPLPNQFHHRSDKEDGLGIPRQELTNYDKKQIAMDKVARGIDVK